MTRKRTIMGNPKAAMSNAHSTVICPEIFLIPPFINPPDPPSVGNYKQEIKN
jgi:hypothetical protein